MIFSDTDKNRLSASPLAEKELSRGQIRMHGNGMRSFKIIERQTESLFDRNAFMNIFFDLKRNNLGVGGNIFVDVPSGILENRFQFHKIVDIPV